MEVQAGPKREGGFALLAAAAVLAVLGTTSDLGGAVLALPGAVGCAALGLRDLLLVPTLRADADGLEVVQGLRRRRLRWPEVVRLRTVTDRRAVLLELELADDEVLVLSRGRLGRDPRDLLEELERVRR